MKTWLADYHVHTDFSDDSVYPMETAVTDAIRLGLSEICFTDHVDYGVKLDWDSDCAIPLRDGKPLANVDYPLYEATLHELSCRYGEQITIRMGLEFGMQTHTVAQYERLFARYPLDFILLSVHEIEDKEFWNQAFQAGLSQREYNERYYQALLALVKQYKNYSVLGHLDLIARYDAHGAYPFQSVRPMVEEILRQVIRDGKGIEVNTAGYRYGLDDWSPSRDILRLYRELGGTILTIGSDSHTARDLGAYIEQAHASLKALGFETYCTYRHMKPCYHAL